MPVGTTLNATTRIASLYGRYCTRGQRLQLAEQLVASNVQSALVRIGPMTSTGDESTASADAPSAPAAQAAPAKPKPAKAKTHKVKRGETLSSIVRKFDCDLGDLARANKLKAPKYAIKPGQSLTLQGCKG
jgi:membrane-bound lytic murein transglycosylase D